MLRQEKENAINEEWRVSQQAYERDRVIRM